MLNSYASVVIEEVNQSCTWLAEDFANIQAIQGSNENEKNKKCIQWQEILHQIDCALNFVDISGLAGLIKIQSQAISAVAKGDLARSTHLFTTLSQAQRTTILFLEMRLEGVEIFPTALFSIYQSIHEIVFDDEAVVAHLISLPQEEKLPIALKTVSQVDAVGMALPEIGSAFESALLIFLKNESLRNVKEAAEQIALLFSRIAALHKYRNADKSDAKASREQLYSQIFQLYAQKISEGCDYNLHAARKIFSALRKKIYLLSTDTNVTLRGVLLQEVLFEMGRAEKKDDSIIELLNYFEIEQQLEMLQHSQIICKDLYTNLHAWDVFAESVEQVKNIIVDHYSLAEPASREKIDHSLFGAALVNVMEAAVTVDEAIAHAWTGCCSVFSSSSKNEQQVLCFLAFLLLLEQIAANKKQWIFSEKNKAYIKIILSDVQLDSTNSEKMIKLGRSPQYFEKKHAELALLRCLQMALATLEVKLDVVFTADATKIEEKLINKILFEIISVLKFLDKKELILECNHLKDAITVFLNECNENLPLVEGIVNIFLQFEKNCRVMVMDFKEGERDLMQFFSLASEQEPKHHVSVKNEKLEEYKDTGKTEGVVEDHASTTDYPLIASPALQKIYLKEAQQLINQLTNALDNWIAFPDDEALLLASHAVHSLAGSSATVGLPSVSALSTVLEQVLHSLNDDAYAEVKSSGILLEAAVALSSQLQETINGCVPSSQIELLEKLYALRGQLHGEPMIGVMTPLHESEHEFNLLEQSFNVEGDTHNSSTILRATTLDETEEKNPDLSLQTMATVVSPDVEAVNDDGGEAFTFESANHLGSEVDAEMDLELVEIFIEEAADYFPQLDTVLRGWLDNPQNPDIPNAALRILHTLKGSARMAGCRALGQHFHAMETEIEQLAHISDCDAERISHLLQDFDLAIAALTEIKNTILQKDNVLDTYAVIQLENQTDHQNDMELVTPVSSVTQDTSLVRVRTEALDKLAGSAAELIVDGARLRSEIQQHKKSLLDLTDTLIRLRSQLRECELVAESSIASKMQETQQLDFDPLEFDRFTRLQELTRMMAESMSDIASIERSLSRHVEKTQTILFSHEKYARAIQHDLKRVRVVRFSSVSERLHHLVRQVARESQREVRLLITGAHTEIDRSLLEKIISPIEHLLRNAITHGIEESENRLSAGKDKCGNIEINLIQQGNEIVITVTDDGRGLDFDRIEQRAKAMGLLAEDAVTHQDALTEFIFQPGFSTSAELTAIAGRGIGMDAVRETVLAQRGVIQVKSQSGQGATFTLFLPLTLATAAVVLIQHGDKQLALPANMVEQVLQLSRSDLQLARQSGQLMWRNASLPLYQLALLLDDALSSEAELSHTLNSVIVLRGVHGQLALEVEAILGNGEVVVRNIGPQASSVKGIVGASVMPDSSLALIINPLLFLTTEQQVRHAQPTSSTQAAQIYKVMVVDDSLTVRRVSQRLIERAGYTVLLARDGLHAIEILQTEQPAIILLDIEMPRMDGFEFLHYLRQDAKTSEIPVVMITSRTAEKHRKHAMELGATAYLGKPFNETELLTLLKSFA